jgi:hypothetical protein
MHPEIALSDEELSAKSITHTLRQTSPGPSDRKTRDSQSPERGTVQVVAHFNPYQRRPIHLQRSEQEGLLKDIRAMIQYQDRLRELSDSGSSYLMDL